MQTFISKQAAIDYLNAHPRLSSNRAGTSFFPSGVYYLAHGEYSQPDYAPRRYKDGWGIHATYCYYGGTWCAPKDGRVDLTDVFSAEYAISI